MEDERNRSKKQSKKMEQGIKKLEMRKNGKKCSWLI